LLLPFLALFILAIYVHSTRQETFMGASILPVIFLALTCASVVFVNNNPDVVPFTPQEISWALRDGYMDDLVAHFLRYGGLNVGSSSDATDAIIPFTTQEFVWAVKGGYLDDLVMHFLRNGGL
jgi:hypothetical protein